LILHHLWARTWSAGPVLRWFCKWQRPLGLSSRTALEPDRNEASVGGRVSSAREVLEEPRELVDQVLGLVVSVLLDERADALARELLARGAPQLEDAVARGEEEVARGEVDPPLLERRVEDRAAVDPHDHALGLDQGERRRAARAHEHGRRQAG